MTGLNKEKVKYYYSKKKETIPTGTCLINTPDSERTMVTFGVMVELMKRILILRQYKIANFFFLKDICGMKESQKKHLI